MRAAEFLRRFLIYGVGNVVASSPPFILMPYLTGRLTPAEFGELAYYETLGVILVPALMIGLDGYYSSSHFKYKNKAALLRILFLVPFVILIGAAFLYFSLFALFFGSIAEFSKNINNLYLSSLLLQGVVMNAILVDLQAQIETWEVFLVKVFNGIINIFTCILFVEIIGNSYNAKIYGSVMTAFFCCLLCVIFLWRRNILSKPKLHINEIYRVIKNGIPFVTHTLGALVFFWADRIIIKFVEGPEKLGIYMVAMQISLSMSLVLNAFGQIWTPVAFNLLESRDKKRFLKFCKTALIAIVLTGICLTLAVDSIYKYLIDPKYLEYKNVAYFGIMIFIMLGVYRIYSVILFYKQSVTLISTATVIAAFGNCVITYIVVKAAGSYYAGLATLFVCSVYSIWISKKSIEKLNEEFN